MDNFCDIYCFSGAWQYKSIFICKKFFIAKQLFAFHKRKKIILCKKDSVKVSKVQKNVDLGELFLLIQWMLLMLIQIN